MFGDGKNFDPTSATTIIDTGKSKISAADISAIIKDAGPGQNLTSQGIYNASDISNNFKAGDSAYAIIPESGGYKEPIFINQTAAGMSKEASKQLLNNDLKQSALYAFNRAKSPMSVQQGMALTILTQRLGPSRFDQSSVLKSIQAGQYDQIARNIRMTSEAGNKTIYQSQGTALSKLWSSPDSMRPDILTIMKGGSSHWDEISRKIYLLHKIQKGF